MYSVEELMSVPNPAWPWVLDLMESAKGPIQVLPVDPILGRRALYSLQVSVASMLGAVALECGGVIVDHGWLRILGGGMGELPDLATVNGLSQRNFSRKLPSVLLVAVDVLGGRFAVNQGGFSGELGAVYYWAPDSMSWGSTDMKYDEFFRWSLEGDLEDFSSRLRWPGWQDEVERTPIGYGILTHPLWHDLNVSNVISPNHRVIPLRELMNFQVEISRKSSRNSL